MSSDPGIVQHPSPVLRRVSRPVGTPDRAVRDLADGMARTLARAGGVGLAAIQVGVPLRMFLALFPGRPEGSPPMALIDPEVTWRSGEMTPSREGCLSIRGPALVVARHARVRVAFSTLDGERLAIEASGRAAAIVQHEIDHLDGRLILDLAPYGRADAGAGDPARPSA